MALFNLKTGKPRNFRSFLVPALQIWGMVLLALGFGGPWFYGPLGKKGDFGWQPIWGLLVQFFPANLFILLSVICCYNYLKLTFVRGESILGGLARWLGYFLFLLALPISWFFLDFTQRNKIPQNGDGVPGWGTGLALIGLILFVISTRLKIWEIKISGGGEKGPLD